MYALFIFLKLLLLLLKTSPRADYLSRIGLAYEHWGHFTGRAEAPDSKLFLRLLSLLLSRWIPVAIRHSVLSLAHRKEVIEESAHHVTLRTKGRAHGLLKLRING